MNKQTFIQTYAEAAMEQQIRYGIPASVTLAQMALESAWGESTPAKEANNYFGIKASSQWVSSGKPYRMYIDDHNYPEKFCEFQNAMDSMEYHSKVLMAKRYNQCRQFSQTDHHNWLIGIKAGGYASDPNYVSSIESIIKANGLDKYDKMVSSGMFHDLNSNSINLSQENSATYCLPLARTEMSVSSGYGQRKAPTPGASTFHKGLDIIAKTGENILATEDNGKVIATNHNTSSASGMSVTVEYNRSDGTRYQVNYMHLSNIACQVNQSVNAGSILGQTGSTGRSTGPHLHLSVNKVIQDGKIESINPSLYLAEISVRGNLSANIKQGNIDLLAAYKSKMQIGANQNLADITQSNNPSDWLKMLSSSDASSAIFSSADPIAALVGSVLGGMLSIAQLSQMQDGKKPEPVNETQPSKLSSLQENVIDRTSKVPSKTIDLAKLSQSASAAFDIESPEQSEQMNNVKLV